MWKLFNVEPFRLEHQKNDIKEKKKMWLILAAMYRHKIEQIFLCNFVAFRVDLTVQFFAWHIFFQKSITVPIFANLGPFFGFRPFFRSGIWVFLFNWVVYTFLTNFWPELLHYMWDNETLQTQRYVKKKCPRKISGP